MTATPKGLVHCPPTAYTEQERTLLAYIDAQAAEIERLRADAERIDWLDKNIFHREHLTFGGELHPTLNMWVTFAPKGVQGSARAILDAAMKGETP